MSNIKFGFTPTHPGEVLKDEIEFRKIPQNHLAKQMGMSYKILNDILNGRRAVTTTTALLFEAALDIPADSLLRMQMKYNIQTANNDKTFTERLKEVRKLCAML